MSGFQFEKHLYNDVLPKMYPVSSHIILWRADSTKDAYSNVNPYNDRDENYDIRNRNVWYFSTARCDFIIVNRPTDAELKKWGATVLNEKDLKKNTPDIQNFFTAVYKHKRRLHPIFIEVKDRSTYKSTSPIFTSNFLTREKINYLAAQANQLNTEVYYIAKYSDNTYVCRIRRSDVNLKTYKDKASNTDSGYDYNIHLRNDRFAKLEGTRPLSSYFDIDGDVMPGLTTMKTVRAEHNIYNDTEEDEEAAIDDPTVPRGYDFLDSDREQDEENEDEIDIDLLISSNRNYSTLSAEEKRQKKKELLNQRKEQRYQAERDSGITSKRSLHKKTNIPYELRRDPSTVNYFKRLEEYGGYNRAMKK